MLLLLMLLLLLLTLLLLLLMILFLMILMLMMLLTGGPLWHANLVDDRSEYFIWAFGRRLRKRPQRLLQKASE